MTALWGGGHMDTRANCRLVAELLREAAGEIEDNPHRKSELLQAATEFQRFADEPETAEITENA